MVEIKSSFRDPSGSLYIKNGILYRNISPVYREHYQYALNSGIYNTLIEEKLLIPHRQEGPHTIIPEIIPFISYPYEWCFSELKDAALMTLKIQKRALDFSMTLKDGSAFNIQFFKGKPIFIDTLSFEKYQEGSPWVGYRQFCQHFLVPLLLMSYRDLRLNKLSSLFIDGLPLDLASSLLPWRTYFKPLSLIHLHIHAKSQKQFAQKEKLPNWQISKKSLFILIDSLESGIGKLVWRRQKTEWQDYYKKTNYSDSAFEDKKNIISRFLEVIKPKNVFDLGANTGEFSRLASDRGINTIAFDVDHHAVEENYLKIKKSEEKNIIPLVVDFINPSSAIGWGNEERMSLTERGPADCVMALAILHHLAISNNVPLSRIAQYFGKLGKYVIIEFIPKTDSNVKKLLATRKDIFTQYDQKFFEKEFSKYFTIEKREKIAESERFLYLLRGNNV